jgi:hypothetical protein
LANIVIFTNWGKQGVTMRLVFKLNTSREMIIRQSDASKRTKKQGESKPS